MTTFAVDRPGRRGGARHVAFTILTVTLSLFVGVLFVGVTALTIGLWLGGQNADTNPVMDVGFFALGGVIVTTGLAAQIRAPERRIAGVRQAAVGLLALEIAGLIGDRIEPLVGALFLLIATAILAALHPARRDIFALGGRPSAPLTALSALAAIPATIYAVTMLAQARQAGPSCFFGACAFGDRLAESAALAIATVLAGFSAASKVDGWRITAWSVAAAAALFGGASIALPEVTGSLGQAAGAAAVVWGVSFAAVGERERRERSGELERERARTT